MSWLVFGALIFAGMVVNVFLVLLLWWWGERKERERK
jgi:hypothetical protein